MKDPAIGQSQILAIDSLSAESLEIVEHEAAGIPKLIGEPLVLLQAIFAESHVLIALHAHGNKGKAIRIGSIFVDHDERIDGIALGLRHPLAVCSLNNGMNQHVLERNGADKLHAREDHARHPEIDDLSGRRKHSGRVEDLQFRSLVRPAESCEGPESRAKPGVEHIWILLESVAATFLANSGRLFIGISVAARLASPHGNPVSPPQLSTDIPVT